MWPEGYKSSDLMSRKGRFLVSFYRLSGNECWKRCYVTSIGRAIESPLASPALDAMASVEALPVGLRAVIQSSRSCGPIIKQRHWGRDAGIWAVQHEIWQTQALHARSDATLSTRRVARGRAYVCVADFS